MSDKLLNININIEGGHKYPLRINRKNEATYRKAAELLNKQIVNYKKQLQGGDDFDYLAMAAFHLAVEVIKNDRDTKTNEIKTEIENINQNLDNYLSQNNFN